MSEQNRDVPGYPVHAKQTGMSQVIPGYPANMCRDIPSYPILYRVTVILRRDIPGYPRISQDKILVLGYPITSFCLGLSRDIPGYTPSRDIPGYPGITLHVVFPDEVVSGVTREAARPGSGAPVRAGGRAPTNEAWLPVRRAGA